MNEHAAFGLSFVTGLLLCTWTGALLGHYWLPDTQVWWAFGATMTTVVVSMAIGAGAGFLCFRLAVGKNGS